MIDSSNIYDVIIIGGGPTGLFAAFYAGLRNLKTMIIESLADLGGQPAHLYPYKTIYDIAAYPEITGLELIQQLQRQIERFDPTIRFNEEAISHSTTSFNESTIHIIGTNRSEYYTRSVIVAAGNGAFSPRKLTLSDIDHLENENLHYQVQDPEVFRGKDVVLCGGGDSAIDWSLALNNVAKSVTLVHRREGFRAHEQSISQLLSSSVKVLTPYSIEDVHTTANRLNAIEIRHTQSKELTILTLDHLIVLYGYQSSIGPLKEWNFEIERNALIVNQQMETNIPGIFAIGDIATYPGKAKIIATGFGEAPIAVNQAVQYIDPSRPLMYGHSSDILNGGTHET